MKNKIVRCGIIAVCFGLLGMLTASAQNSAVANTNTIIGPITAPNTVSNGLPSQVQDQLPPGAPAFNPAGLSFTNVNYKLATGTELLNGGSSGTLSYLQADADLYRPGPVDLGIGLEAALSPTDSGLYSAGLDAEVIKNLSNFQLTFKVGGSRHLADNPGWFINFGLDANYNLAAGTGLSFLGAGHNWFTYVGAGTDWTTKDFSFGTGASKNLEKDWRIYVGWAF